MCVKKQFSTVKCTKSKSNKENAFAALSVAHYAYILEVGRVVLEGPGRELLENPKVKDAYLGG
mgnify:CR=1 FL=1